MSEKGMIFGAESIQAILAGSKTQTRRVMNPQPNELLKRCECCDPAIDCNSFDIDNVEKTVLCRDSARCYRRCHKGDIIYVKETCCKLYDLDGNDQIIEGTGKYYYAADNPSFPYTQFLRDDGTYKDYPAWCSPRYMPKAAARIWLKITGVRVERLQDISPQDCHAEGIMNDMCAACLEVDCCRPQRGVDIFCGGDDNIVDDYAEHWNKINGKKQGCSWEDDPYVFVYEFERVGEQNE